MANEMLNINNMDDKLEELGRSFTSAEAWKINKAGIMPFYNALKGYYSVHRSAKDYRGEWRRKNPDTRPRSPEKHLIDTLVINKEKDGSVATGFSKAGKKAYLARFLNDGWDVRNQYGGPYRHVEGGHYWEKAEDETAEQVKAGELEALKQVMRDRGL